jgi:broad specificity phosphatase PhoE/predicted kinase
LGPRDTVPLLLAMVGLPARGKTFIARKLERYLNFVGHPARVFNVGSYRRERLGASQGATFFDPENTEARSVLDGLAMEALDDALTFLERGGRVAIYDATNSTVARRDAVRARVAAAGADAPQIVFVESKCDDPTIIDANVRDTKLRSPDYMGVSADDAVRDFRQRIEHYARMYEPLAEGEGSFIRIIDVGQKVVLNRIQGYLPARLVPLLISMHVAPRPIYLSRHGESEFNVDGRIGGDSGLSGRGRLYAERLAGLVRAELEGLGRRDLVLWTSTLRRTIETSLPLGRPPAMWKALDEIDAGRCDGMTYEEIRLKLPAEHEARKADKFRYRYPRGESYEDVIQRLDPVAIELERQRSPVLVIAHNAIVRALYAYLMGVPSHECPTLPVPLHTVIKITPTAYGCEETRLELGPRVA